MGALTSKRRNRQGVSITGNSANMGPGEVKDDEKLQKINRQREEFVSHLEANLSTWEASSEADDEMAGSWEEVLLASPDLLDYALLVAEKWTCVDLSYNPSFSLTIRSFFASITLLKAMSNAATRAEGEGRFGKPVTNFIEACLQLIEHAVRSYGMPSKYDETRALAKKVSVAYDAVASS